MYNSDTDSKEAYATCENLFVMNTTKWSSYNIQESFLFKDSKFFIPICPMQDNLIKLNHSGGLVRQFGVGKTFVVLNYFYFWPRMHANVKSFMERCRVCQ